MKKHFIYIYICLVATVSVLAVIFFLTKSPNTNTIENSPVAQLTNDSMQLETTTFSDICDCYLVVSGYSPISIYESSSGNTVSVDPFVGSSIASEVSETSISPSGKKVASIQHDQSTLVIQETFGGPSKTLYVSAKNEKIGFVRWSPEELYIAFAIESTADAQPTEGLTSTAIKLIRLTDGKSFEVITRNEGAVKQLENVFPITVSSGAKTIWFSSGTMENAQMWSWSFSNKEIQELQEVRYSAIYNSTAFSKGETKWLSFEGALLHVYNVNTGIDSPITLHAVSDQPLSLPNPSGDSIVYLQQMDGQEFGIPVLLDLRTKESKVLSYEPVRALNGLANSFWSPDGKYFVYSDINQASPKYYTLRADIENQLPSEIVGAPAVEQQYVQSLVAKLK